MTPLPKDPTRLAAARALLRRRAVAKLVYGREPLPVADLVRMLSDHYGISQGSARAAIDRAAAAGEIDLWATVAPSTNDGGGPDPDAVLAAVAEDAAALEEARRAAGEADGG